MPDAPRKDPLTWLYPAAEPFRTGRLPVSPLHTLHYEECGNPQGRPIVFLHGGPGGGCDPLHRRFFHPGLWRAVLPDQRGCGRSTPNASLEENTTWDLVEDLERLRKHLGIDRWTVFGGSWGSTLALAYAEAHPEAVAGLILRGISLMFEWENVWLFERGASALYPDAWEAFLAPIPPGERGDLIRAYHRRLTSEEPNLRDPAVRAWVAWEDATSLLVPDPEEATVADAAALACARLECHYFLNNAWLTADQLLAGIDRIRHIPGVIVQGRYDLVCPMASAWALHRAWPEAELVISPDAGHSAFDPPNSRALVAATDRFGGLGT
jgi:proline iminopeptidase